jgi:cell division protein FtsQ
MFNIKSIEVKGNQKFSQEYIINLSGMPIGQNIFKINYIKSKKNILADSYIKNAKIDRKYPSKLIISVEERKPIAAFQYVGSYLLVDNEAFVLQDVTSIKDYKIPTITGIKVNTKKTGSIIDAAADDKPKVKAFINCMNEVQAYNLTENINLIDFNNINKITAWSYNNKYQINLMSNEEIPYKFEMLAKEILPDLEASKSPSGIIDFTMVNKPTFKPKN